MAATDAGRRLTEAHRLAQARLGRQTVLQMLTLWPLLDLSNLDRSFPNWLRAALALVSARRTQSSGLAGTYLTSLKMLEIGKASEPQPAPVLDERRFATSMLVTGPAAIRAGLVRGDKLPRLAQIAQTTSARAAMRHTLSGGRDTIANTVAADRDVRGWARVTSGRPCAFCAMLASRGPVYAKGTVDFKTHDGCGCTAEPVYRDDNQWPPGSTKHAAMWDQAKSLGRDKGIRADVAFRQLVEGRA